MRLGRDRSAAHEGGASEMADGERRGSSPEDRVPRDLPVVAPSKAQVKALNQYRGKALGDHLTHFDGTNVDIGFYYQSKSGLVGNEFRNHKRLPNAYVTNQRMKGGKLVKWSERYLKRPAEDWDLEANWAFVQELLEAPEAEVTQILVDKVYADLLEQRVREVIVDTEKRARALKVIQWSNNHDNHFHIQARERQKPGPGR